MKLQFLGAAQMVTGSSYLLETGGHKILIDCGLFQGSKRDKERNYHEFPFSPKDISQVLLTHAHTDHTGLVPKLYKDGYAGTVITTIATVELCKIMLPDSGHIQEMEVERKNRKRARAGQPPLNPIYTAEEAADCVQYFKGVEYNETLQLFPGVEVRFQDAGHILGSSMIEIWVTEDNRRTKLVFSGDIGNIGQPYINDPSCIPEADYLIMESTYGNRLHGDHDDKLKKLKEVINRTLKKGGNLVIPSFAIERTQDLLYYLELLYEKQDIPPTDVYIDSPLAVAATEIFRHNSKYFDQETKELIRHGEDPLNLPKLHFSITADESKALNEIKGGAIIIAASGMADAGRIKHHLKHNLWRPESTVLFVGYQAEGTLGRRLINGEKKVVIHGEEVAVKADLEQIDGFSAHADQTGLLNWVRCSGTPKQGLILVHGEEEAQAELAGLLKGITGLEPLIPALGETFQWTVSGMTRTGSQPEVYPHLPEEPKPEAAYRPAPKARVTHAQLEKALLNLRHKLNQLVDRESREKDLEAALQEVHELTRIIDRKL